MPLTNAKQTFADIQGTRCRVIESGITEARAQYLKGILEHNRIPVLIETQAPKQEGGPTTLTLGTSNLLVNPIIAVFERSLRMPDGRTVTPALWNQEEIKAGKGYWEYGFSLAPADTEAFTPWEYRSV